MATKISKQQKILKSLNKAAAILNKVNMPTKAALKKAVQPEALMQPEVVIFQVFCPDHDKPVGGPTTDFDQAEATRDNHNNASGHTSFIITSGTN